MRRLLIHEARVHALPNRILRDLGDAILLTDPEEPEPFWNRLEAIRWPDAADAFDRRLTESLVQFSALGRQAHIWASPLHDEPNDLVARLTANGFRDMGAGQVMILSEPSLADQAAAERLRPGVGLERLAGLEPPVAGVAAARIVGVLLDAFEVHPDRRPSLEAETVVALSNPRFTYYLASVDEVPAAVARRATFDAVSYLSSIGTALWARGRGLGRLVTSVAASDGTTIGSDWVYLGVDADNHVAMGVYERSGFRRVGEPAADLLLVSG